ncbi:MULTISPECIES: SDR family NAD(P)-dependent oxidoreductase [Streptacidiphilus]|uniref:SDR family NAD(P)-dependent oxidoreductase n=2 Tax=Streptacidiphilus TaxID=228398 RepID=A0ABV6UW82_9ACTN|nr:SDR family NAD(P)-dependent oxidoreductase [Streptacidiphilus jeojiense]
MTSLHLQGRTALVTGGTRGIGRATAHRLAQAGATVLLTGRSEQHAKAAAEEVQARHGTTAIGLSLEMTDPAGIEALMARIAEEHPELDILVANAGVMGVGALGSIPAPEVRSVVEVNVLGTFAVLQGAARIMAPRGRGSIVLLTSLVAALGVPGMASYAAAKGAIAALTLSAAQELGPQGIRVNAVAPGTIETDMLAPYPRAVLDQTAARTPLGRLGTAEDVAGAVAFLAGDDASFITGHILAVDGGLQP